MSAVPFLALARGCGTPGFLTAGMTPSEATSLLSCDVSSCAEHCFALCTLRKATGFLEVCSGSALSALPPARLLFLAMNSLALQCQFWTGSKRNCCFYI